MRALPFAWIVVALFAGFAAAPWAQEGKAPEAVRASRFELADKGGKVRAVLGLSKDGSPELDLRDAEGRPRALLLLDKEGLPILLFKDREVVTRAKFELDAAGGAKLTFADKDQTPRFEVEATAPFVRLSNPEGKVVWKAP